jgi:hypothetical protein
MAEEKTNPLEGEINVEYEEMLSSLITSLTKERLGALAQGKVIANKYNELLKANQELNEALINAQEELSHKNKEINKLKKSVKNNAKSEDISE